MEAIFAVLGTPSVIDFVLPSGLGAYSGQTLEQLQERYPGTVLTTVSEHQESFESRCIAQAPALLPDGEFSSALGCMPPQNWTSGQGAESFEFMEHYSGRITSAFIRYRSGKAYSFFVVAGTPHADKLARVARHCGDVS